jgi:multiple antibiotic resistance protein
LLWASFLLAITALFPLVNPVGSALVFAELIGEEPSRFYHWLASQVALATVVFLLATEYLGSVLLRFFGLTLPIVQITGGLVMAASAWHLLFEKDSTVGVRHKRIEVGGDIRKEQQLLGGVFYPYTFPITAGPGTLVTMITLSAHASSYAWPERLTAHGGIALAAAILGTSIYVCYGFATSLLARVSVPTLHGIMRVMAFILMCNGAKVLWSGLEPLVNVVISHR